jgi:hypothetical protein
MVHKENAKLKIKSSHSSTHTYNRDVLLPSRENTPHNKNKQQNYKMSTFLEMPTHIHVYSESLFPCPLPKYSHFIEHPSVSLG